jgi:CRP-like cAMP-binding protein
MAIPALEKYIQSILPMPEDKAKQITEKFNLVEVFRNDLLIKENEVSRYMHFLEEGYVRSFAYDNDNHDATTNIFSAPCVVNDLLSYFKQQPATENFQALTDCKTYRITFEDMQYLFHNIPEFREYGRLLLVNNYTQLHQRVIGMIKDTAESRYLKLLEKHPGIFQNVPLKVIASYLGITDSSLSRIRKELTRK